MGEHYHENKARVENGKEEQDLKLDWKRAGKQNINNYDYNTLLFSLFSHHCYQYYYYEFLITNYY